MSFSVEAVFKSRIALFSGEEPYLRLQALRQLHEAMGDDSEFNIEQFIADGSNPEEYITAAMTLPFLGDRRLIIVRNILRAGQPADALGPLFDQLSKVPEPNTLLFVADDELGDDDKQRRLATVRKAWETTIAKLGGKTVQFESDDSSVKKNLKEHAGQSGKALTPKAMDLLVEMTGGNLSRALAELDKLVLYVGDDEQISEAAVKSVVMPSREWNVFKLVGAAVEGNSGEALRQLETLIEGSGKIEDAVFSRIFPTLSRQLRLIWQARLCVEARCRPSNAPVEVLRMFPTSPNLPKERDWIQNMALRQAQTLDLDRLSMWMGSIAQTDATLKGLGSAIDAKGALEMLVLQMATRA